jgi:cytochrome c peroxidase
MTLSRMLARAALPTALLVMAACHMAPPRELDVALDKASRHDLYHVALIPPAEAPRINQLHSWQVRLTTSDGAPVTAAHFEFTGGMPQHGHGFPTKPRVTRELGNGLYLLEGMKFSMTGWWQIRLGIAAGPGDDEVTFNTVVGKPRDANRADAGLRDRWTQQERELLASMQLSRASLAPEDPSNAWQADAGAARLGRALFEDTRFSRNGEVACATCHLAQRGFQDGVPVAQGVGTGHRRTMPVTGARQSAFLFWDGRKDSLWSQALGPIEDAAEHGFSRARVAMLVRTHYASSYEAAFGPLPHLPATLPDASPLGNEAERAAWQALPAATRDHVNRIFANVGKAIAAHESRIAIGESAFDRYVAATLANDCAGQSVLTAQQVRGLRAFIGKGQCATCHEGPLFTDHAFHNTGVPPRDASAPDRGRAEGAAKLLSDEFNCLGPYSDAKPEDCGELRFIDARDARLVGAFRTPSLRNVAQRAPYMHAGQMASLQAVVAHYVAAPHAAVGSSELASTEATQAGRQRIRLTGAEQQDVVAFLEALDGPILQ